MKLFSYPVDLFTWALLAFTLFVGFAIIANKRIARTQKYLALSLNFFAAGVLGLIALYSLALAITVCVAMMALCIILYRVAKRKRRQISSTLPTFSTIKVGKSSEVALLSDSDPRLFPGTRLIGPG